MHDRNGTPLTVGDTVVIFAKVKDIQAGDTYCNATLDIGSDKPHGPYNVTSTVTINTKQVLLVDRDG